MAITKRIFKLDQPARKSGGDRYEEITQPGEQPMMGRTYVNQSVSRPGGRAQPVPAIAITIETSDGAEVKS